MTYGVEPICKRLQVAPSVTGAMQPGNATRQLRSARAQRDEGLIPDIERVWQANCRSTGPTRSGGR